MTMTKVGSDDPCAAMKKMFPYVERTPVGKCPRCGMERYRCVGYVDPSHPETKIDMITACQCDIEKERHISDVRASAKVNEAMREIIRKNCGFRAAEADLCQKKFTGSLIERYNKAMLYASRFNHMTKKGILIVGSTGSGKTMTAAHVINRVLDSGYVAKFTTAGNIYDLYKSSFNDRSAADQIENLKNCDLLCVDDLGTEYTSETAVYSVIDVIESRIGWSKPTLITTNLSEKEILERYGKRFVSRLHEHFFKLVFAGEDMRMKKSR